LPGRPSKFTLSIAEGWYISRATEGSEDTERIIGSAGRYPPEGVLRTVDWLNGREENIDYFQIKFYCNKGGFGVMYGRKKGIGEAFNEIQGLFAIYLFLSHQ